MTRAYQGLGTRSTPQNEPIPGKGQVPNSAGGYGWRVDRWTRLDRFLVLGSEGGTYYIGERELTKQNAGAVMECLAEDGSRTVKRIVEISTQGRAAKNTPAILALAMSCAATDPRTKREALDAIPAVCRTGTHLFQFASLVEQFRGWGRSLRRGIGQWYEQDPQKLAYQLVKYRQREGWTHRDLLRLAHVEGMTSEHARLYDWATHGLKDDPVRYPASVEAFERAQRSPDPTQTAALIHEYGGALPREALKDEHMTKEVWEALVTEGMPMTALIRNLANLTRKEVLQSLGSYTDLVCQQITDGERLRKARVHPYAILLAMATYNQGGHGGQSRGETYTPITKVLDALDAAFYEAFGNVEPSGKRTLLALDVSGSMSTPILGSYDRNKKCMKPVALSAREGSAAMAMVTNRVESCVTVAFASGGWSSSVNPSDRWGYRRNDGIREFDISRFRALRDVVRETNGLPFGGTDCALPMLYASDKGLDVDTFVIYTDSETWAGTPHPSQALVKYREKTGILAKLIVVGMASNGFSIADPNDQGMLDCVGFDTATPNVIADFSRSA